MNSTELYQFAYKLHYNSKNYAEAYKIYNKIVKEFEDTKEANYARNQIKNIQKLNLVLKDSDTNSEMLDEYILEKEKCKFPTNIKIDTKKIKISTSNNIDGYVIDKYIDIINSETVLGTGLISEFDIGISDIMGERSDIFEKKLSDLNASAIYDLKVIACKKGGNAVIGIHFDYTVFAQNALGVIVTGTVVSIKEKEEVQIENIPNMIEKMFELKNKQIITEEEYEEKRKILLDKIK